MEDMEALKTIRGITEQRLDGLRTEMDSISRLGLDAAAQAFFKSFPQIQTVYWHQFIPTFNDGDPCLFSVNEIHYSPLEYTDIDGPYGNQEKDEVTGYESDAPAGFQEMAREFEGFIGSIADYLQRAYECDAFVRVHRGGVIAEYCEPAW